MFAWFYVLNNVQCPEIFKFSSPVKKFLLCPRPHFVFDILSLGCCGLVCLSLELFQICLQCFDTVALAVEEHPACDIAVITLCVKLQRSVL